MSEEPDGPTELVSGPDRLVLTATFPGLSREELFERWIEPAALTRWWPPVAEVEPHVGGRYHLSWPAMDWLLPGRVTRLDPPTALGFTWSWQHEPTTPSTEVMVAIEQAGSGSRLTLTHGPYPDTEKGREMRQGHVEGWMYFLPRLQALPPP